MQDNRNPFLSRKWWSMVVGVIAPLLAKWAGVQLDVATVVGIILPVVTYIVTEGVVDRARAQNGPASPQNGGVRAGSPDLSQLRPGA